MNSYLFIVGDYLKGKPVYQPLSRILNLLFSISIASFLFEQFYFKYHWLDATDYKGLLDFLVKGYFVVPFSLFLIVHYILSYGSDALFTLVTFRPVAKWQKVALEFEIKKNDTKKLIKNLNRNSLIELPQKLDEPTLVRWYRHIKETTDPATWNRLRTEADKMKVNINRNFNLTIKAMIVISVYFNTIPYFGWLLYAIVMLVLLGLLIGLRAGYILVEFLPIFFQRLIDEAEKYLSDKQESANA